MRSLFLCFTLILACSAAGISQTRPSGTKGKQTTGIVNPDSVRAYMRALSRKDTTALKRYNTYANPMKTDQPRTAHLVIMARTDRDSIVLRWAPSKPGAWIETNKFGYLLDRVSLDNKGKVIPGSARSLTSAPLRPWTLDEWKDRVPRDNRFAAVAAQALYGTSFKQDTDAPEGVVIRAGVDELEGRFGFALFAADMDPLVANGLAVRYVDRNVRKGEQYVYRLRLAIRDTMYQLDTAYAAASPEHQETPPPPLDLTAEGFDRHITLRWSDYPAGLAYSAFNIYRSENDGKTYTRLNANPVVTPYRIGEREKTMPTYTDTTIVNFRPYRYQVRGITPFAEESKSAEIEAYGTDRTPPPRPTIGKPEQVGRRTVRVTWEMPDTAKDIAGFVISRSADNMQGYAPITIPLSSTGTKKGKPTVRDQQRETAELMKHLLPPATRLYVDTGATSAEPYYMVGAVDTSGNLSQSLPAYAAIIDSLPPKIPTGLAGRIDTNGVVHLHWNLGPEPNIIGYRVVWANDPKHEFTQRTPRPVKDTVFTDTVNVHTLTHYIYYRIAAVNDRFIHSPLSPILALHRPDVVPPGSPVFTHVHVSDSSVALAWATSSSDDVRKQLLYRRRPGDSTWAMVASLSAGEGSYVDRAVQQRMMYEYTLEAVDSAGLRSQPAVPVQGRPYDTGERAGITGLTGSVDAKTKSIRLSWIYGTPPKEKFWFVIYRAIGAGRLTQYRSVEGKARGYNDTDLIGKGKYRYAVRVVTGVGGQSTVSPEISVVQN